MNEEVVNQFEEQHGRGTQGFGIIDINKDGSYTVHRATEGAKFMFDLHKQESSCMIVHHRTPTSSPNYLNQTHPILVDNGSLTHKYLVIHNGCINNSTELKKKHEELGFVYTTADLFTDKYSPKGFEKYNDSESLAIEAARFIEKQTERIGAYGSAAFIAVQIDKAQDKVIKIFFGRNEGNPLNMSFSNGKLRLSSEGEGENIKEFMLYSWDFKGKIQKKKLPFAIAPVYQPIGFQAKDYCSTNRNKANGYASPYPMGAYNEDFDDPYDDNMANITEFRGEEVTREVDEFFELLADDLTFHDADIKETLKNIELILSTAKIEAEKYFQEKALDPTLSEHNPYPITV